MKTQFAESAAIQNVVGDRCKFVVNLQDEKTFPVVVYNAKELEPLTKDNASEYALTVFVLAQSVKDLLDVYEVCKTVMYNETTDFVSWFVESSYPGISESRDDVYIIDINYKIVYKAEQ
jgi:hypothetical protein